MNVSRNHQYDKDGFTKNVGTNKYIAPEVTKANFMTSDVIFTLYQSYSKTFFLMEKSLFLFSNQYTMFIIMKKTSQEPLSS